MTDIVVTSDGEFMVAQMEGETIDGLAFVDAYAATEMVVADYGRIVLPVAAAETFISSAQRAGLTIAKVSS